jgi:hypothetical protein
VHRVRAFQNLGSYKLRVEFEDGVSRTIDFLPVLAGELYGPLREPTMFDRVRIDPDVATLVWPNGADFDPASLHDWPDVAEAMGAMARRWAAPDAPDVGATVGGRG